jgi:DNA-binding response OmpR family regulator
MRVLIAEDEPRLAEALARGLRRNGCAVDVSHDGRSALDRTQLVDYDAIVLDRDLPVMHGDDVCRELRRLETPPRILMLTAAATVEDRIDGLELGADDYLCKPFAFAELVARLQALQRRGDRVDPELLQRAGITLDPARRVASRGGEQLDLTPKEFGVLEALLRAEGAVLSSEVLLQRVWDEQTDPFTNTVRVTVMNLRRKLGEPAPLKTVISAGYQIP